MVTLSHRAELNIRQANKHQAISRSCVLANAMTVERRNAISRCQWQNGVKYLGSNPGICVAIKMLLQSQLKQSCLCLAASNLYAQAYSFTLAPALCLHANLCPFSCFIFVTLDFRSLALTILENSISVAVWMCMLMFSAGILLMMHFDVLHYYEFTSPSLSSQPTILSDIWEKYTVPLHQSKKKSDLFHPGARWTSHTAI